MDKELLKQKVCATIDAYADKIEKFPIALVMNRN